MLTIFGGHFEIGAVQKYANLLDLVKSFPTSIFLAKIGIDTAEYEPLKVWRKIPFIIHWPPYSRYPSLLTNKSSQISNLLFFHEQQLDHPLSWGSRLKKMNPSLVVLSRWEKRGACQNFAATIYLFPQHWCKLQMPICHQWMVHLKVGDFSCRTIGFISLIHPTVLPTAEKRRYEILRKTRLERFAGIGDRAGLPNKIRMLYKVPTPAPNLIYGLSSFEFFPFPPVA